MAVQAQYPSNVLLLNRNGQEGNDYSLQGQAQGGGFVDQTHMVGGGSFSFTRKRGRDGGVQTQPSQLIHLSQLHNNVVSTGLQLSFTDPHQIHHQQNLTSLVSEDFANQIKQQRDEIDQFLQTQGEQLRRTLAEKRSKHYRALLSAAEESVARRLREKEAEAEKASRRQAELEARAAQLRVEAQVWQAKARAEEATVASLQAQLHQAMMCGGGGGDDGRAHDDAESACVEAAETGPRCRACRERSASVVVLPCRHLCLCTHCHRLPQQPSSCPICLSATNSTVQVFFS